MRFVETSNLYRKNHLLSNNTYYASDHFSDLNSLKCTFYVNCGYVYYLPNLFMFDVRNNSNINLDKSSNVKNMFSEFT